jgi:DNA polymerase elongation subunit (family B)
MSEWNKENLEKLVELRSEGKTWKQVAKELKLGLTPNNCRKAYYRYVRDNVKASKIEIPVKVLILDIETAPIVGYVWGLWDQSVALNQIVEDWSVLSWSAKWLHSDKVMYQDTRNETNPRNDKEILKGIWNLLDEADVVIGQNSKSFDIKKLNARFALNGMKPPSSFRQIDTMRIAKKHFAFTSNKLEYLTKGLCTDSKKSEHKKFPGFSLWKECLAGNLEAWKEMEMYNITDILSTEELYHKLKAWDQSINFNTFHEAYHHQCACGSIDFKKHGFVYSNNGKYRRFICEDCGAESVDKENLLIKEKRKSLRK